MSVVNAVNLVKIGPIVLEYRMFKENLKYIMIISDLSSSHYSNMYYEATPTVSINRYM